MVKRPRLLFADGQGQGLKVAGGQGDQDHLWTDAEIAAMTIRDRRKFRKVRGGWRRR
jgi:hypothetical protein